MNIEQLLKDVLENRIDPAELDTEQLDAVLDALYVAAQNLMGTDRDAAGHAIMDIIEPLLELDKFELAIRKAEARGSVYWEFETPSIH